MRVRRQTAIGKVNAPAIEEFAAARDSDEHRQVTVLGDADGRGSQSLPSHHVPLSFGQLTIVDRVSRSRSGGDIVVGQRHK
jgi:hypothetical protein